MFEVMKSSVDWEISWLWSGNLGLNSHENQGKVGGFFVVVFFSSRVGTPIRQILYPGFPSEVVACRCSSKYVFLKSSQISQENTRVGVVKKNSNTGAFL